MPPSVLGCQKRGLYVRCLLTIFTGTDVIANNYLALSLHDNVMKSMAMNSPCFLDRVQKSSSRTKMKTSEMTNHLVRDRQTVRRKTALS